LYFHEICIDNAATNVLTIQHKTWRSSVIKVSDDRFDDRGSIQAEAKDFSPSLCVKISSEALQVPHPICTGDPFRWWSAAGAWRWSLTPIKRRGKEWVAAISPLPLTPA